MAVAVVKYQLCFVLAKYEAFWQWRCTYGMRLIAVCLLSVLRVGLPISGWLAIKGAEMRYLKSWLSKRLL